MIIDENVPLEVSRSPEGAVTVHVPAGAVDWKQVAATVLPLLVKIVEGLIEARAGSRDAEPPGEGFQPQGPNP